MMLTEENPEVTSETPFSQPEEQKGGNRGAFLKIIVFLVALLILVLIGSVGYYFYSLQKLEKKGPATTYQAPSPTQAVTPTLSEGDKTVVLEGELTQTSLEDFEGDFVQLQQEAASL